MAKKFEAIVPYANQTNSNVIFTAEIALIIIVIALIATLAVHRLRKNLKKDIHEP